MKRYITLFITILCITWLSLGQERFIERSDPDNATVEYIARDYIRFLPGYSFSAASGKALRAAIDVNMVVPAEHLPNPTTINMPLSTTCSIGSIPGVIDVSQTGAATYTIPIEVAQGVMGVQPNIALAYNSQMGNGIAGWGFNISGLSAIARVPKNIYLDTMATGVKYDANDVYALDGNRLLAVNGTYGLNGTEYRTEMETFAKITSKGNYVFSGPDWFEVIAKDGTIYRYGSASGKLEYQRVISSPPPLPPISHVCVQAWQLDYVKSPNGQTIIYEYENRDLCSYIKKISYGNNSVEFFYEIRDDVIPIHFCEKKGTMNRILHKIVCRQAGTIFRQYELQYTKGRYLPGESAGYRSSYLTEITESNGNGETYNPTLFKWGDAPHQGALKVEDVTVNAYDLVNESFLSADINGDGLTDLVSMRSYRLHLGGGRYEDYKEGRYYMASKENNGNIKFTSQYTYSLDPGIDLFGLKSYTAGGSPVIDSDGDGKQEILLVLYSQGDGWKQVRFCILKHGVRKEFGRDLLYSSEIPAYTTGDLNNDGKTEIIYLEKKHSSGNNYRGEIVSLDGNIVNAVSFSVNTTCIGGGNPEEMYVADFDGDGMNDLFVLTQKGYIIYYNNGGTLRNMFSETNKTYSTSFNSNYSRVKMGDFNGDGLPDFLLNEHCTKNWYIVLNNGDKTFSKTLSTTLTNLNFIEEEFTDKNDDKDECFVLDFNGNGKSDVVINDAEYFGNTFRYHQTFRFCFDGNDFILAGSMGFNGETALKKYFVFGDFNGDGIQDMMFYGHNLVVPFDYNIKWRLYSNLLPDCTQSKKITGIRDGLNNTINLEYAPLSDNNIYQKGGNAPYPVAVIQAPLSVVKKVTLNQGFVNSTTYAYKRAKVHLQGKGFLGFDEITASNTALNRKTVTKYDYDNAFFYPYMKEQKITTNPSSGQGQAIATTTCTTTCKSFSGKRFFPYISSQTTKDELTSLTTKTEITSMDDYGNPKTVKTTKGGLTETQTINYINKGSWCDNRVEDIQAVRSFSGDTHTRKTAYEYDNNGNLTKETIDPDDENMVVTEYQNFNSFGQPQNIKVTANGISRISGQTYTSSGRFVRTRTNVLGETITYDWDESKGILTSVTDHRNKTTQYGYNNWGILTSTTYPDGIITTNILQWASLMPDNIADNAQYCNYTRTSGQSPVWVWYDRHLREIRREYFNSDYIERYIYTEYDPSNGRLYRILDPDPTTYAYDEYGRIKTVTYSNLHEDITNYEYSNLGTTVTSPAGTRKTTLNNVGWVISEETNGKNVTFAHYASGLVKSATPQGGQALTMEYNLQGNRTKLTDPNAGKITSKYNGWGELKRTSQKIHTDQDSIVTQYYYLPSGLPDYMTCNGEVTNYAYDNLKRLQEISIAGQHKQIFTYDTYDRITKVREEFDGKSFERSTEYDSYGRTSKEIYPSGYFTKNRYNNFGYLIEVEDNAGNSLWKAIREDACGKLNKETKGGKEFSYSYDRKGRLLSTRVSGNTRSYLYDTKGNMVSRKYSSYKDSMTYDNMNRLTSWDIYSGNTILKSHSMTYNSTTGNIEYKNELNNYTMNYGGNGKPHALTSISGLPDIFPLDELKVTYTDFNKIKTITEGDKSYTVTYGVDRQRRSTVYKENGITKLTRYYLGDYEEERNSSGNIRKIHYLRGGSIFIQNSTGPDSLLYTVTDHLGSLTALINQAGAIIERHEYDPWGNRRNPDNWTQPDACTSRILNRGFTGHEHIDQFGIINMNGRVYDPLTSQFFSPDPFVQTWGNWLNYDRYAYCLNNPLLYTDPSGEWFGWDDAMVAGAGFVFGYVSHGITTGNWGWNAVGAGGLGALSAWFGYNTCGISTAGQGISSATWNYVGSMAINTVASQIMPPMNIPIGNNFALSISPSFGIGANGLNGGINLSASYHNDDWTVNAGAGIGGPSIGFGGGASYKGYGLSYSATHYSGEHAQWTGTLTLRAKDFSFRIENDVLAFGGQDRWRTNAIEIAYGKFSIGSSIYTNDPAGSNDKSIDTSGDNFHYRRLWWRNLKDQVRGMWNNGQVYSSPVWIGYRSGNQVYRFGYSFKEAQNFQQNEFVHRYGFIFGLLPFGTQNFYKKYDYFQSGPYSYYGTYQPYSLYGY